MRWADLDREEQKTCKKLFKERIFPVLTPLAVDPAHPFPYISGLSLNLAVVVRNPKTGKEHFARVKVPPIVRPLRAGWATSASCRSRTSSASTSRSSSPAWRCSRRTPSGSPATRTSRSRRTTPRTCSSALEKELLRRRFGPPVRLEVEESIDPQVLDLLVSELGVARDEVFQLPGPLDLARPARRSPTCPASDLKYPAFLPSTHAEPRRGRVRRAGRRLRGRTPRHDVLLHHPYDSFATSVQRFIEQAAADPHVLAIKQTLYRTSGDSPIIDALIDAAEAGKQVLVIVEIKARFDEQANIRWARKLEQAGCHVVYGLVGLKTHCKLSMVVRDEPDGIRRYTHIGTGNYNPKTARLYEDLGLLTADPAIGEDVAHLFNNLSGCRRNATYDQLLVAPDTRARRADRRRSTARSPTTRPAAGAGIRIKANSIVDEAVIDALYLASQAGVPVELLVRGICALRPGVPGLSETIQVRSDPGSLPRAQPGLLVRQRRRAGGLDRLGRHDAPQPGPPGRGARAAAADPHVVAEVGELLDLALRPTRPPPGTLEQRTASGACNGGRTPPPGRADRAAAHPPSLTAPRHHTLRSGCAGPAVARSGR